MLFSCSVVSNSLRPHGLQHARLPCPSSSPRVCSNSCPLNWWCPIREKNLSWSNAACFFPSFTGMWSEVNWKSLSRVQLFVTPWTIQSIEFSRPEYWSGWLFPSPRDLPNPGIKSRSPSLQEDSLPAEHKGSLYWGIIDQKIYVFKVYNVWFDI